MSDAQPSIPRPAADISQAAEICVRTFLPTDPVALAANALGLHDALSDWTRDDLLGLVAGLAGWAAHLERTVAGNSLPERNSLQERDSQADSGGGQ